MAKENIQIFSIGRGRPIFVNKTGPRGGQRYVDVGDCTRERIIELRAMLDKLEKDHFG